MTTRLLDPDELSSRLSQGEAYRQAGDYLAQARVEAEEIKRRAQEEGFRAGLAEGRAHVLAKVAEIEDEFRDKRDALRVGLTDIVFDCLNRVMGSVPPGVVIPSILRKALDDYPVLAGITIRVPFGELETVRQALATSQSVPLSKIELKGDSMLRNGDILLETPTGRVHVGPEAQFNALAVNMRRAEQDAELDG